MEPAVMARIKKSPKRKPRPDLLGNPTQLGPEGRKVSVYLSNDEWQVLNQIAVEISGGLKPTFSEVVRFIIRDYAKLRREKKK